jgi:hypothetical protein
VRNAVQKRRLGNSALEVSIVGLGGNNFGGRIDFDASQRVVHKAIELGVNLIDTADSYGSRGARSCAKCASGEGHRLSVLTVSYPGGRTRQFSLTKQVVHVTDITKGRGLHRARSISCGGGRTRGLSDCPRRAVRPAPVMTTPQEHKLREVLIPPARRFMRQSQRVRRSGCCLGPHDSEELKIRASTHRKRMRIAQ